MPEARIHIPEDVRAMLEDARPAQLRRLLSDIRQPDRAMQDVPCQTSQTEGVTYDA